MSVYEAFARLVKEKGRKLKTIKSLIGTKTIYKFFDLIISIDNEPFSPEDLIVAIDDEKGTIFLSCNIVRGLAWVSGDPQLLMDSFFICPAISHLVILNLYKKYLIKAYIQ